ncbi:MAG TPA: glycosyltransferase family 39 protein, partial [Nitrospira sp.]
MNRFPHLFNPDRPQFHLLLFGIILFSTLSKLILYGLVMTYHPNGIFESSDSTEYQQLALNLFQQGTFSRSPQYPYDPEIIRTPAYPLMLAGIYRIFGVHPALVVFAQIALSVATIFISFKIATCLFHKQAGLLTAFLLAADPVSAYYTQVILTETAFTTTLSLCVLLLLYALKEPSRWQWSVGASLSLALSTYIRPTSYYLGFLLPFIFFLMIRSATGWRRASIPALAFFTLYGILVGSWQLHNYAQTGSMEFSQTKNQYLFVAKAAGIVAARDNLDLEEAQRRLATEHYQSIPPALRMAPPAQLLESQGQYAMNI